jgi:predicted Zn-dependent protease
MLNITNKDELALVLGHELAHYKLGHHGSNHRNEYAADALGYQYAAKAGYNVCRGKNIFKKFRKGGSATHPDPRDRIKHLPRC